MNRVLFVLLIGICSFAIAACSTESAEEEASPTPEPAETIQPDPTATPTPEPTATPDPTPTPEPEPTPEPDPTATPEADDQSAIDDMLDDDDPFNLAPHDLFEDFHDEELAALLLDEHDVPSNWTLLLEGSVRGDLDTAQFFGDFGAGPCANDHLDLPEFGNSVHVGRGFSASIFGPFISQDIYSFEESEQAIELMEQTRAIYDCDEWIERDPSTGMNLRFSVEEVEVGDYGDDVLAIEISVEDAGEDIQASVQTIQSPMQSDEMFDAMRVKSVFVRSDALIVSFILIDLIGFGGIDLEELVAKGMDRIESADR